MQLFLFFRRKHTKMSSPWERGLQAWERLAAWQPCPQHYSWYKKTLSFCCPEDSFIHLPLNLENRSLFFSFPYRTSGSREEVNSLALRTTAGTRREFHLLAKDRGDRPVLPCTRLQLFPQQHWSTYLGPLHPCCRRCGLPVPLQIRYLPALGPRPGPVPPSWRRQVSSSPRPLGIASSSCSWWRPCNSHLNPTCVRGDRIRNRCGKGQGSSEHWKPSSAPPRWTPRSFRCLY